MDKPDQRLFDADAKRQQDSGIHEAPFPVTANSFAFTKHDAMSTAPLEKFSLAGQCRSSRLSRNLLQSLSEVLREKVRRSRRVRGKLHCGRFLEDSVHLGARFSAGSAEVVVTKPRLPGYKLGIRFESDDMVKRAGGTSPRLLQVVARMAQKACLRL